MKKCPACQSTYTDETLVYCLQDGVPLENADSSDGEHETIVRRTVPEAVTVAIAPETETEEVKGAPVTASDTARGGGARTLSTILLTVLAMFVFFGGVGIAAFFFFREGGSVDTIAANSKANSSSETGNRDSGANSEPLLTPEPTNTATPEPTATEDAAIQTPPPTPTDTPTPTPTSTPEAGDIKRRVTGKVYKWKSLAESRSLGPYMNLYGPRIDYYRKKGASRGFVRNDKQKAFSKFSTIRIKISGMKVTPSTDGKSADAVFDKEFFFSNSRTSQSGKVRTRLVFRKIGGDWRIVSERDLKVYYVNK